MITFDRLFVETVTERIGPHVLTSSVRKATVEDIEQERTNVANGEACRHIIVYDEPGWLFDVRVCGICGAGLGTV